MAHVLLGWSLGQGFGHVAKLAAMGERLVEGGHRCTFALAQLDRVRTFPPLQRPEFQLRPAPRAELRPRTPRTPPPRCAMSALAAYSFHAAPTLEREVRAWDAILEGEAIDVVVTESAPALDLAVRGRVPRVMVGTGTTVPPSEGAAFPLLLPNVPASATTPEVLAVVNLVQSSRGAPELARLPALYDGDRVVGVIRELDPYEAARASDEARLPFHPFPPRAGAPAEAGTAFAYLAGEDPASMVVLEALAATGMAVEAYVRRCPDALAERAEALGVQRHASAQDFSVVMPRANLIVHHGGIGTAHAAAFSGRPQLIVPRYREADLNGRRLAARGVAEVVPLRASPSLQARIQDAANRARTLTAAALEFGAQLHERESTLGVDRAVELVLAHL